MTYIRGVEYKIVVFDSISIELCIYCVYHEAYNDNEKMKAYTFVILEERLL